MIIDLKDIPGIATGDWVVIAPSLVGNNELVVCRMSEWKEEVKGYLKEIDLISEEQKSIEEKMIKSAMFRQVKDDLSIRLKISTETKLNNNRISDIISVVKIDEVIMDFVELKKRGTHLLGLCPFHKEKTPSFVVSPKKSIFKCFGCGKSGNAITFIMDINKVCYLDSIRYLAWKYNIPFDESEEWGNDSDAPF